MNAHHSPIRSTYRAIIAFSSDAPGVPSRCMAPILPLAAQMRDCVRISGVVNDVHNQRRKAIASVEAEGIAHKSALDNDGAEVLLG